MIYLVTGTGTDVGKTVATAALACVLPRPRVLKPAQTGEPEGRGDANTITRLTGLTDVHELARYPEPLAPLTAARRASMPPLGLSDAARRIHELHSDGTSVLVEGAGGLLVELGADAGTPWTLADLAAELHAPVIVVTTTGLGSLNHAALTLEALERRGLRCAGLVGGSVPAESDLATRLNLEEFRRWPVPWLGAIPAGVGALGAAKFRRGAAQWLQAPSA